MNLAKAMQRAVRFCAGPKDKDAAGVLHCVRLWPGTEDIPPRVGATNGTVGILLTVDPGTPVPNALVLDDDIKPAAKFALTGATLSEDQTKLLLQAGAQQLFDARLWDAAGFPPIPDYPDNWLDAADWWAVLQGVHAAGGRDDPQSHRHIQVKGTRVWATDARRITAVDADVPFQGLVPAAVFERWPKGPVRVGRSKGTAWWQVGEEVRWARISDKLAFPDVVSHIPDFWTKGPWCTVRTDVILAAVKQGVAVSRVKTLKVEFGLWGTRILARQPSEEDTRGYVAEVPGKISLPGKRTIQYPSFVLDGKMFLDALKQCITPCVRLCYAEDSPTAPLRIESGRLVEVLWPML